MDAHMLSSPSDADFESGGLLDVKGGDEGDNLEEYDEDDEDDDDEEEVSPASVYLPAPEGHVKLRPSNWRNILSTVFVDYPPELGRVRNDTSVIEPLGQRKLLYSSHWERVCIKNAFIRSGFTKTTTKSWTCLWSKHQNDTQMKGLNCLQKINHFQASWCIGRKDRLARTMQGMMRKHGDQFNFHPQSYILPSERDALHRHIANDAKTPGGGPGKDLWIKKPCASSCGQGIQVLTGSQVTSIGKSKKCLVQKYVADPYLIDGNKFDLRLYVVITGVDPLRVYVFKEGLTRISTSKYSLKNLGDRFAHLTNYSINKKSKEFKKSMANDGDIDIKTLSFEKRAEEASERGTPASPDGKKGTTRSYKWSYTEFKSYLAKKEGDEVANATHERIIDLLVKTMIGSESVITPHLHSSANYRTNCFELFGCDVMLDSKLKPHLVEVNISPSLMGGAAVDKLIKGQLIADILHVVGVYPNDPKLLKKYDDKDSSRKGNSLKRLASAKSTRRVTSAAGAGVTVVGDSSGNGAKTSDQSLQNPFAFGSMSKMMAAQDAWRRKCEPSSISMKAIGNNEAVWVMLLMVDDEFKRCESTQLVRAHPLPETAAHYNKLYFSSRFSDQLLAKWVIEGGGGGPLRKWIPDKFLPAEELRRRQEYEVLVAKEAKGLRGRAGAPRALGGRKLVASSSGVGVPTASEPPLLRPAAARPSPHMSKSGASVSPEKGRGKGKAPRWARQQSEPLDDSGEMSPDKDGDAFFWAVNDGAEAEVAGQPPSAESTSLSQAPTSSIRRAASHHDFTDREGSTSPSGGGSASGSASGESSVKSDHQDSSQQLQSYTQAHRDRDRHLDSLLSRADENLYRIPLKEVELENMRKKMINGSGAANTHRSLLANHPTLKGRDPVGMSNLPRMSMNSGAVPSGGEDPLAVLALERTAGAHELSSSNVSTVESGSRVSRHLRDTVRLQRQVEKMASRDITKMKHRAAAAGFDDGMMFSVGLGSEVDSHSWAERGAGAGARAGAQGGGVQLNSRTKKALMPSAPATGSGQGQMASTRRGSGVKLRSRSKPAGL